MNRRQFGVTIAGLGLPPDVWAEREAAVEKIQLSRNGWVPNNDRFPVLLYHQAFGGGGMADRMEALLERNLWPAQWRNGVYTFHQYHSTAHEMLGFAGGRAQLMLGGRMAM